MYTALLVTMQIFVVVLVVVVFVTGFSQPTIRVCLFCFCLHVFSIALHSYCCARLSCACVYLVVYNYGTVSSDQLCCILSFNFREQIKKEMILNYLANNINKYNYSYNQLGEASVHVMCDI